MNCRAYEDDMMFRRSKCNKLLIYNNHNIHSTDEKRIQIGAVAAGSYESFSLIWIPKQALLPSE